MQDIVEEREQLIQETAKLDQLRAVQDAEDSQRKKREQKEEQKNAAIRDKELQKLEALKERERQKLQKTLDKEHEKILKKQEKLKQKRDLAVSQLTTNCDTSLETYCLLRGLEMDLKMEDCYDFVKFMLTL